MKVSEFAQKFSALDDAIFEVYVPRYDRSSKTYRIPLLGGEWEHNQRELNTFLGSYPMIARAEVASYSIFTVQSGSYQGRIAVRVQVNEVKGNEA